MGKKYWIQWCKAAGVRALKTFAQAFAASVGVSATISEVNWIVALSTGVLSAILSLVTSVAGLPELKDPEIDDEN